MTEQQLLEAISDILGRKILKKAVFSKAVDKNCVKEVVTPLKKENGGTILCAEKFTKDNKTFRRNLPDNDSNELCRMAVEDYYRVSILTTAGSIDIMRSKSGTVYIGGKLSKEAGEAEVKTEGKKYILDGRRDAYFLSELGISDKNGRIHDKKQAKYRQINKFLEIIRDTQKSFPEDRTIIIYDLCCGKSYLTFAVYYFLTKILGKSVRMYGIDLKKDVIEYCSDVAKRLNFTNLFFEYGNINTYEPPEKPDMVISLHACDIATDIVLANSVKWGAEIILSTPCCHHEMSKQLSAKTSGTELKDSLSFILDHGILKQKLSDILTDSLRVKRLESVGYDVTTLELIDPDETPKNLMIRAIKNKNISSENMNKALVKYQEICKTLGISPTLDALLKENEKI